MYKNEDIKNVAIKAEFDPAPIRHLAIQCPECKNWFVGHDILEKHISYEYELSGSSCKCPICHAFFVISTNSDVDKEADFPEFYKKCKKKKTTWE